MLVFVDLGKVQQMIIQNCNDSRLSLILSWKFNQFNVDAVSEFLEICITKPHLS